MATCSGNQFTVIAVEIATSSDFKGLYLHIFMFYSPYSSLLNLLAAFLGPAVQSVQSN
jgi:hypothetical protein